MKRSDVLACMDLIVTPTTNHDEIASHVGSPIFVVIKMMELKDSWISFRPAILIPSAKATSVPIPCIHGRLDGLRDPAVVGLRDAIS